MGTNPKAGIRRMAMLAALLLVACVERRGIVPPVPAASAAQLPLSASPLMREIADAAGAQAARGPSFGIAVATSRNAVDPVALVLSTNIFPAMAAEIEQADAEVDFQTFHWDPDCDAARTILAGIGRLADRRRLHAPPGSPPVVVHLLVDAVDLRAEPHVFMPKIADTVGDLHLDPALVRVELGVHSHVGPDSFHAKTLVVDGRRAIVTGANAQSTQDYQAPWFDAGFRMDGEIAAALRMEFADAWARSSQWSCGEHNVLQLGKHCLGHPSRIDELRLPNAPATPGPTVPALMVARSGSTARHVTRGDPVTAAYLTAFRGARKSIRILTPNLNATPVISALLDAVRRGVVVQLVVSKGFNQLPEDIPGEGGDNAEVLLQKLYRPLQDENTPDLCNRFAARWYSWDGASPVSGNGPHASHAKYASIDGELVIVGSANMDTQSWSSSREVVVVVDDTAIVEAWDRQVFEPSFARGTGVGPCDR